MGITVNYEAGPMGYSETREEKLGFVEIRSKPARVAPAPAKVDQATLIQRILAILQPQIGSAVSSAIEARKAEAARLEAERRAAAEAARLEAARQEAARLEAARLEAEKLRPHVLKPLVLRLRDVQQPKQPLLLLLLPPPTPTQPTSLAMEVTMSESRLPTSRLNTNTEDEDYTRPSKECDILPATDQTTDRRLTPLC